MDVGDEEDAGEDDSEIDLDVDLEDSDIDLEDSDIDLDDSELVLVDPAGGQESKGNEEKAEKALCHDLKM